MERAITLPFSVDSSGSILSSSDQRLIWQSRVTAAVLTELGERVFRPEYGGNIKSALFQPDDEAASIAASSIRDVFGKYLKPLVLGDVSATLNQQDGTISLTIDYTLPNREKVQLALKTGTINRSGEVIQEF